MRLVKCSKCETNVALPEYWDCCEACWNKRVDEIMQENIRQFKRDAKIMGITFEEYMEEIVPNMLSGVRE